MATPARFWSEERNLTWLLAALAFDTLALDPVMSVLGSGVSLRLIDGIVLALVLLLGLFALTRHKAIQTVFGCITLLVIAARFGHIIYGLDWLVVWDILLTMVCIGAILAVVLSYVYKDGPVTHHRIQGAVAGYLLIAMIFACGYLLISNLTPGAFRFQDDSPAARQLARTYYYFSICTLTTVGYGDIIPLHPFARSLAMVEALFGQLYPIILIARLVTLYDSHKHRYRPD